MFETSKTRSATRGATAAVVATVAVLVFALAGGVGLAGNGKGPRHGTSQYQYGMGQYQYGIGQYQYGARVVVCHKGKRTVVVSRWALAAHLRHGDAAGRCADARRKHRLFRTADGMPRPSSESMSRAVENEDDDGHGHGHGQGKGHGKGKGHDD